MYFRKLKALVTASTLEKPGGPGKRLSFEKGLVELHGGTLAARCDGEGQGSEFVARLPLATPDPGEADRVELAGWRRS